MNFYSKLQRAADACVIRPATRAEFPEITELVTAAIGAYRGLASDKALDSYLEHARDTEMHWERGDLLVAAQQGEVLGTVTWYSVAAEAGFPAGWASFGTLAVRPDAQGQGIASLLVRHCIARSVPVASDIGIHTGEFMHGARRLYEGMGFIRATEHDRHASDFSPSITGAEDVHIMGYRLNLDDALSG